MLTVFANQNVQIAEQSMKELWKAIIAQSVVQKWMEVRKMGKKKVNPRRKPATQADIIKAKKDAQNKAINSAWAIFFTVMVDKEGYGRKRLNRIWNEVSDLSDSISKGYVSVKDLMKTLEDEMGIVLEE